MKNHCLAQCHLHILYVSHCQENFIASKHERAPGQFLQHRTYVLLLLSERVFVCVCAPFAYLLHIIRIASSISTNYNKLAKYSPNSVPARSALFAHLKLIAKTLYIFVQLQPPLYSITSLWDSVSVYELHQMMRSVYFTCVLYRRS